MNILARRAMLAGAAGLAAAGTLATVLTQRKPAAPDMLRLLPADEPGKVVLQSIAALRPTEPARPVPDLAFSDADGTAHHLAELAGSGVVLNIWATWCQPCIAEMPSLATLAQRLHGEPIVVLPLATDHGGAGVVERFLASHHVAGLPVRVDPTGEATQRLGLRGVPTTLIIDRAGRERARLEGAADWASDAALAAIRRLAG
jgi:thiol-disulfide isomerase/thioredoxin